jgi:Spy/CpxP family protein refolding chaperone
MNPQTLVFMTALIFLPSGLAAQDTLRTLSRDSVQRLDELWGKRVAYTGNRTPAEQDPGRAFEKHLFPPELVMQHQARLKITEAQRNFIVGEITKLQATAVQVQWRVGDESEKLAELLQREPVAEAEVLAQADRLIMQETAVKRAQLSMLIRIRNTLTPEQRMMLQELRKFSKE